MIQIGVIGYGYWGPNVVRNFNSVDGARVTAVCDKDPRVLEKITKAYPGMKAVGAVEDIVTSPEIDVVAVVTSVSTHYELAKKALENGKHVFVEKPFTMTSKEAESLINIAERKGLKIMVDHTFLFTGSVKKIKELIDNDTVGNIYYYDSTRLNLGLFQHDINVVWDLAPHDFAIMNYLVSEKPVSVSAFGKAHVNHFVDNAYITFHFNSNVMAHISVNWISPVKIRNVLIGGEKKMLVWNDIAPDEKIKVYDKGVQVKNKESIHDLLVSYRSGDMLAPQVSSTEALKFECEHFIRCIEEDKTPMNDGRAGLDVVRMLEACDESMRQDGKTVELKYT